MQYKTISVQHSKSMELKDTKKVSDEYQNILNEQAAQGWILLGIHPIQTNFFQEDIFVFFKEDEQNLR